MWIVALVLGARAAAQGEACAGVLPLSEWQEAMDAVDEALVNGDGTRADRILDSVVYEMRCLWTVAPPDALGRLARQLALVEFFSQDFDETANWALLARQTVGGAPWFDPSMVPPAYFDLVEALPDPPLLRAEGGLLVPKGGGVLLDGTLIRDPVAVDACQHLVQVLNKQGEVLSTAWQTGATFPPELLTDRPVSLDVPRWYRAPLPPAPGDGRPAPIVVEPVVVAPVEPVPVPVQFDRDGRTAECPWSGDPRQVEVHGRSVQINERVYAVGSGEEQLAFKKVLRACGEFRAARRFTKWRQARGNLFSGAQAYRNGMVEALLTEEPTGRGRAGGRP